MMKENEIAALIEWGKEEKQFFFTLKMWNN